MHVLMIVANNFLYDSRVSQEAFALKEAGFDVTVIDWDRKGSGEKIIEVRGVQIFRIYTGSLLRRIRRWSVQIQFFWNQAFNLARLIPFDILHCHDLDTLPVGLRLKKMYHTPLVYDAHEIFPFLLDRKFAKALKPYFIPLERTAVSQVDRLIMAESSYTEYFSGLGYRDAVTVLNCKPLLEKKYRPPVRARFTLCYFGSLMQSRFIPELIDVMSELPDVELEIGGRGPLSEDVEKKIRSLDNVYFFGLIPHEELVERTRQCHAVVCMIDPGDRNNSIASANKQFEAMVAGRPVIATKGTRSGQITEEEECGLVIPYTREALRDAIVSLKQDANLCETLGKNGLRAAVRKYNWDYEKKKLITLYNEICGKFNDR